jgi:hypothetical protein
VKEQEKGEGKQPQSIRGQPALVIPLVLGSTWPKLRCRRRRLSASPARAAKKKERFLHPRQQQISLASFHFGSVNIQERTFSSGAVKSLRTHAQGPANIFAACKIHFCWCQPTVAFTPGHQRRTKKNTQLVVLGLFTDSWNGGVHVD